VVDPRVEWLKCSRSVVYFVLVYVWIYNATTTRWLKFELWEAQRQTLAQFVDAGKVIILKARQLGISWLVLSYCLWKMLFRASATILLFSLATSESEELLLRLKGMYEHLPDWLQCRAVVKNNEREWVLSNGSRALAFSTRGGRSYTGTVAVIDEADFVPNLADFLNAIKPTTDAGGQLFLISTSDKARPLSAFKMLFRAAWRGLNDYLALFLPWHARPGRTDEWYRRIAADMRAQRGSDDDLHQEYPATPEEALAARSLDKRIPADWVDGVFQEASGRPRTADGGPRTADGGRQTAGRGPQTADGGRQGAVGGVPGLPGLVVFRLPEAGRWYVVGADSAEGNPNSDESAAVVLDADSLEQVAVLAGRFQPATFAAYVDELAIFFNGAAVLPERNNHGHSFILWMAENGRVQLLAGTDGKPGWLSNVRGKTLMYDKMTDVCRDGETILHDNETAVQLASIEASTLRAPEGMHDDRADALALAVAAARLCNSGGGASTASAPPPDPVAEADRGGIEADAVTR
jgi:hypothetical protein